MLSTSDVPYIFVITGFLGSGKTTLLNNLLLDNRRKVGVLVNEFGRVGIDGARVQGSSKLIELTNGSIFCACLKDDFISSLKQLIDARPDYIFVESSGLSDPSNMGTILEFIERDQGHSFVYGGTICLIDGLYFLATYDMMVNVQRQVAYGNLLVINKADLIDSEGVARIKERLRVDNPHAHIVVTSHGNIPIEELQLWNKQGSSESVNTPTNRVFSAVLSFHGPIKKIQVQKLLERVQQSCFRIKGNFLDGEQSYQVDSVMTQCSITPIQDRMPSEIVFLSSIGFPLLAKLHTACNELLGGIDFSMKA